MDRWLTEMNKVLMWLTGSPTGHVQPMVVEIAGIMAFVVILTKAGDLLVVGMSSAVRSLAILVTTLVFWFPLTAAANLYAAPKFPAAVTPWLPAACALLVVLAISTPLTRIFQKANYGKGLLLMLLSIGAAIGVMLLTGAAFATARHGENERGRIRERTGEMDDFLSK